MVGARQTMKKTKHVEAYDEDKKRKAVRKLKKCQNLLLSMSTVSLSQREFIFTNGSVPCPDNNVKCPKCEHSLTIKEVNDGFLMDEYDFTTECPNCSKRFISTSSFGGDHVVWLCESQTKAAFSDWSEENDHIFFDLVKRPEIIYNIHRYAVKEKITVKDWIKKYFPNITMENKKTLKLYSVVGKDDEYVISAYNIRDIEERKEDIKFIGFAGPDVEPETKF